MISRGKGTHQEWGEIIFSPPIETQLLKTDSRQATGLPPVYSLGQRRGEKGRGRAGKRKAQTLVFESLNATESPRDQQKREQPKKKGGKYQKVPGRGLWTASWVGQIGSEINEEYTVNIGLHAEESRIRKNHGGT